MNDPLTQVPDEITAVGSTPTVDKVRQCGKCAQILPESKFRPHPQQWCVYCVADDTAASRDKTLRLKAEELARKLLTSRNADQAISTIEDFFGELDVTLGGARMIASRMGQVIDGLIDKGKLANAGALLLQLQKLRFLVQKQHIEEDFTQLDLEQKRAKLEFEITQYLLEQREDGKKHELLTLIAEQHGMQPSELDAVTTLAE
jgi:hypothetical protein